MSSKPIQKLMDCHTTKRWTLCGTSIESNVAGHSFNVACIAMTIWERYSGPLFMEKESMEILYHAMFHDADEAETGDIPTPTKTALKEFGVNMHALTPTQGLFPPIPEKYKVAIKLADLIENYIFIKWYGVGPRANAAAHEVRGRLEQALYYSGSLQPAARSVFMDIMEKEALG